MIQDLDETLKQLLVTKGRLNSGEIDITFDAPDREWVGKVSKPTINLFLYDVHENVEFRQHEWIGNRRPGNRHSKSRPPAWIDLSYLATVWTQAIEDEHRLLWHVLSILLRFPLLPKEVMRGTLVEMNHSVQTQAAQSKGPYSSLAELWSSLEIQLKPSLNYLVTLPLDRMVNIEAPVVTTKRMMVVQRGHENGDELVQVGGRILAKGGSGHGVADLEVCLSEKGLLDRTDPTGVFSFSNVPEGKYTLIVEMEDGQRVNRAVFVPSENYDIQL